MTKATHNGTCQVCGNVQAIQGTTLAKHGYTVNFGFFNGTCTGANAAPIEFDTTIARNTIENCEERATKLEAVTLADVTSIVYVQHVRGKIRDDVKHTFRSQDELDTYRNDAVRPDLNAPYSFDRARESRLFQIQREAKLYREHAALLEARISSRHGAEPYPRDTGDQRKKLDGFEKYRDAVAAAEELKADGWKTRVNGRRNPYNVTAIKKGAA